MACVGIIYYGKCNCDVLVNCIRHYVRGEFVQIILRYLTFY